ncbi:EF-hand domain-containing protein [Parvibaculum sedimenti]|uniref:EF-hand domain-containing protein n=1 Tax=Parvibaculum sedimenti TaxID=2608632 RepID=UPI00163A09CE|nr:EF-hand domain-containing protein [Parvibaculum sedimenti]
MRGLRAELIVGVAAIALGLLLPFAVQADNSVGRDAAREARFKAADTNGDGAISHDEFIVEAQKRAAERAEIRFKRIDTDGNGKVTKAEYDAAAARRYERMKAHRQPGTVAKPGATAPKAE